MKLFVKVCIKSRSLCFSLCFDKKKSPRIDTNGREHKGAAVADVPIHHPWLFFHRTNEKRNGNEKQKRANGKTDLLKRTMSGFQTRSGGRRRTLMPP